MGKSNLFIKYPRNMGICGASANKKVESEGNLKNGGKGNKQTNSK